MNENARQSRKNEIVARQANGKASHADLVELGLDGSRPPNRKPELGPELVNAERLRELELREKSDAGTATSRDLMELGLLSKAPPPAA